MTEHPPADSNVLLDKAETALNNGKPSMAMALLHSAQPRMTTSAGLPNHLRRYLQLQAIARIQIANKNNPSHLWDIFGIGIPSDTSKPDLKRQYKRLAALIHPDKCNIQGAGEAFSSLQNALNTLLERLEKEDFKGTEKKKARFDHHSQEQESEAEQPTAQEEGLRKDNYDDDEERDDEFAWWTKWDDTAAEKLIKSDKMKSSETEIGDSSVGGVENEMNESVDDQKVLESMSSKELEMEVRARQDDMFAPLPANMTLQNLRERLLRARTALNKKIQEEKVKKSGNQSVEGGFLI